MTQLHDAAKGICASEKGCTMMQNKENASRDISPARKSSDKLEKPIAASEDVSMSTPSRSYLSSRTRKSVCEISQCIDPLQMFVGMPHLSGSWRK